MSATIVNADVSAGTADYSGCALAAHSNVVLELAQVVAPEQLAVVRLLPDHPDDLLESHGESAHSWLQKFSTTQSARLAKAREDSLIRAQSLDSTAAAKVKYPAVYCVMNCKETVPWPPGFPAKPVSQAFVRTFEAGAVSVS